MMPAKGVSVASSFKVSHARPTKFEVTLTFDSATYPHYMMELQEPSKDNLEIVIRLLMRIKRGWSGVKLTDLKVKDVNCT
jgi:hypothetical protein